jgi:hypothetical protein
MTHPLPSSVFDAVVARAECASGLAGDVLDKPAAGSGLLPRIHKASLRIVQGAVGTDMNRRELLKAGVQAAAIASVFRPGEPAAQTSATGSGAGDTIFVNPATGADANSGAQTAPLKTLAEAGRRVSQSAGTGSMTVVLSKGIHAVGEPMLLRPQRRSFSAANRLTIRAEFLPDDPGWTADGMPTLIFTIPFTDPPTWNGRPDAAGGAVDGILIEASHVSILGLKFLGLPVLEGPRPGIERRLYGINRSRREFQDLEIGHCMFLGDYVTNPVHVAIIANGNGIDIHHTIFWKNKITAVYWQNGSTGHAMRNCVITGCYGSGIWTAGIAADFRFENNVVDDCRYAWTYQGAAPAPQFLYNPDGSMSDIPSRGGAAADAAAEVPPGPGAAGGRGASGAGRGGRAGGRGPIPPGELVRYTIVNSHFGRNLNLTGSGTGATLGYVPIDSGFLEMVGSRVTNQPVPIEMDQRKRNYLHPVAGSDAARVGAGLFAKPIA